MVDSDSHMYNGLAERTRTTHVAPAPAPPIIIIIIFIFYKTLEERPRYRICKYVYNRFICVTNLYCKGPGKIHIHHHNPYNNVNVTISVFCLILYVFDIYNASGYKVAALAMILQIYT